MNARSLAAAAALLALAASARPARACAVCGAGERTLPTNGSEVPFAGRVRATLDARLASFAVRDGSLGVVEGRLEPGASAAVGARTMVAVIAPVLRRSLTGAASPRYVPGAPDAIAPDAAVTRAMPGDVELRATHTAFTTGIAKVTRRFFVSGGLKLPTAPVERDASGALVPPDLQPGCSSIAPEVGASYVVTSSIVSAWAAASFLLPIAVRDAAHAGDSLRGSIVVQVQPASWLAARAGVLARLDGTGAIDGVAVPDSGGGQVQVAPEVVLSPGRDVVVSAGASVPVVQAMRSYRVAAPIAMLGVGVDW